MCQQTLDEIFWIPIWRGDNLPLFKYSRKIALTTSLRKARRGRDSYTFILVNTIQHPRTLKNNIYHSNKWLPPSCFHSYTNRVFGHVMIHSFDKTHIPVVIVELIWFLLSSILSFNFVLTQKKILLGSQDSEEAL